MSTDKQLPQDTPFGYAFEDSELDTSSFSYPPPNDRPLLHDEESGFLESFFNNPNDVDPSSLISMPSDFHSEGNNVFGSTTNFDWLNPNSTDFGSAPIPGSATQPDWQEPETGQATSGAESLRTMPASSDVYAAAGILHNNNAARQQGTSNFNGYSEVTGANGGGNDITRMNGYQYPPLNSSNGPDYNFNSPASLNSPYNGLTPRFGSGDNANPYVAGLQGRLSSDRTTGGSGLNFGTDDSFRNSIFSATSADQPDKDLADAISHNFTTGSYHRGQPAPAAVMRKRDRASDAGEVNDEDESKVDDGLSKRRRMDKLKDEDERDYEDGTTTGDRKSRRKRPSTPISAMPREMTSVEKISRTSGGKQARENLTEEQKRNNHIQSEQKRRNLIKQGFDDLNRMVPELRSGSLSKSNMLQESARFIRHLKQGNDELEALINSLDKG